MLKTKTSWICWGRVRSSSSDLFGRPHTLFLFGLDFNLWLKLVSLLQTPWRWIEVQVRSANPLDRSGCSEKWRRLQSSSRRGFPVVVWPASQPLPSILFRSTLWVFFYILIVFSKTTLSHITTFSMFMFRQPVALLASSQPGYFQRLPWYFRHGQIWGWNGAAEGFFGKEKRRGRVGPRMEPCAGHHDPLSQGQGPTHPPGYNHHNW